MYLVSLFLLLVGFLPIEGAPAGDKITHMPGLLTQPSFGQYSGYLDVPGGKHFHYWFVESEEEPSTSPLVLWLNGGPGCSSVSGLLTEHGPFLIQMDGNKLKYNPFSWNKIANILYLESPAGVGFSYSEDKQYETNDTEVTNDNYSALKDFFRLFPEYIKNDFYITGESYGGVYVPTLAVKVSQDSSINLKGIAVGNGILSYDMNDDSLLYFSRYHGILGSELWSDLLSHCCTDGKCSFSKFQNMRCWPLARKAFRATFDKGTNIYNLYQPCSGGVRGEIRDDGDRITVYHPGMFSPVLDSEFTKKLVSVTHSKKPVVLSMPCVNSSAETRFMNKQKVRTALHIPVHLPSWEICSDQVFQRYDREVLSLHVQFKELLKKEYRILVYSGDFDMACNFLGNEWFVDSLNLTLQVNQRPWLYMENGEQQIAGFVKEFTNLVFLTIKGAGHMAPTDKPKAAFVMFSRFIQNKPF
ncbi:lysosomal protective protein-like [Pelodytes ibericus]